MENSFNKKLNTILEKEKFEQNRSELPDAIFQEINPENLSLSELKRKIENDIIELQISLGGLRNQVTEEGADPHQLTSIYDDISKQIFEKREQINQIEGVLALEDNRESVLTSEEKFFLDSFRSATEDQNPDLN